MVTQMVHMLVLKVTSTYMLVVLEIKHLVLHVCTQTRVAIYHVYILIKVLRPIISEKPILDN